MNQLSRAVLIVLAVLVGWPLPAEAFDPQDRQDGVVQIINTRKLPTKRSPGISIGRGTGFVINDDGYVATNHHVIKGGLRLYVNPDGSTVSLVTAVRQPNAKLIWASSELDLAILKVNDPDTFTPVTFAKILPRKGESVFAVGYPGAADQNNIKGSRDMTSDATVTDGVLSRSYLGSWRKTPLQLVQHNAEISWGNSGGPLFDECRRVIGVNTRLAPRKIGKQVVVAPGAFFASNISELMKVLDERKISYSSTNERCLSQEDQLQNMLRNSIFIGIAGFLVLTALLVVALRRPREKVVQLVERASRSFRSGSGSSGGGRPAAPTNVPRGSGDATVRAGDDTGSLPRFGLTLDGYDTEGKKYKVQIDKGDLVQGVTIGREPPDPRFTIHNDEVSRQHATMYAKDGMLYVRDEDSTNGTFLNGRSVRPRYSEIAGNGDELRFGPVTVKILFV